MPSQKQNYRKFEKTTICRTNYMARHDCKWASAPPVLEFFQQRRKMWRILSSFPAWSDRNRDFGIEYISFWMIWSANFEIIRWWEVDIFRGRNLVEFHALEPVHSSETWAGTNIHLQFSPIALLWTLYKVSFVSTMLAWGNIPVFPVFGSL